MSGKAVKWKCLVSGWWTASGIGVVSHERGHTWAAERYGDAVRARFTSCAQAKAFCERTTTNTRPQPRRDAGKRRSK